MCLHVYMCVYTCVLMCVDVCVFLSECIHCIRKLPSGKNLEFNWQERKKCVNYIEQVITMPET